MLKQNIQWEGFDGQTKNKTLYFNLTRFEISHDMELELLEERFRRFLEEVIGDDVDRRMTPPEVREMLDIIKVIVKHAYGYRHPDGERFTKNEEVWNEFVETGAFDAFIWYLFEDPERANSFMQGIWPKEIQQAAEKEARKRNIRSVQDVPLPEENHPGFDNVFYGDEQNRIAPDDNIPSIEDSPKHLIQGEYEGGVPEKDWYEWDEKELLEMTDLEFKKVIQKAAGGGKNTPPHLLVIGQKRKQATIEQGEQPQ